MPDIEAIALKARLATIVALFAPAFAANDNHLLNHEITYAQHCRESARISKLQIRAQKRARTLSRVFGLIGTC